MISTFGKWNFLKDNVSGKRIESNSLIFYPNLISDYSSQLKKLAGMNQKDQLKVFPIVVSMYLGNYCRDNCKGCFAKVGNKKMKLKEPKRRKKEIIKELIDLGITHFKFGGGGDPLASSQLEEVLEIIHKNESKSTIITNGDMITDKRIPILGKYVTNFRFSGNADNQKLHQLINRPSPAADDFNKRIRQVSKLVQIRKRNNLISGTTYLANPIVPGSVAGIEKYLDMAINIGFDYFAVRYVYYYTPLIEKQTRKIDKRMKVLQKKMGKKIKIIVPPRIKYKTKTDFMLLMKTTIDYYHNVYPCPSGGIYNNCYSYGSLEESTFKEIWLGNRRKEFIKTHINSPSHFNYCKQCNYIARNTTYNWIADRIKSEKSSLSLECINHDTIPINKNNGYC